jgi:hypothetical protein
MVRKRADEAFFQASALARLSCGPYIFPGCVSIHHESSYDSAALLPALCIVIFAVAMPGFPVMRSPG